jgi:hypothetical protein
VAWKKPQCEKLKAIVALLEKAKEAQAKESEKKLRRLKYVMDQKTACSAATK